MNLPLALMTTSRWYREDEGVAVRWTETPDIKWSLVDWVLWQPGLGLLASMAGPEENCIFLCLVCVHVRVCVCACVCVISGETHEEKLEVLGWEGGMGREMWRGEEEHNYVHEMYMLEASLTNINSQQWKRMTGLTFVIYIWKLLHQLRSQL